MNYPFQVPTPVTDNSSATLQIDLMGFSSAGHHTQIFVNGNKVDDASWSGQTERRATISFPQAYLNAGGNTLRLTELNDLDGNDFIFTNNFDVGYASSFTATNDALRFHYAANGTWAYTVGGLTSSSVEVFDITDPRNVAQIVNPTVTPSGSTWTLQFADSIAAPHEYWALTTAQRKTPTSITRDKPSDLRNTTNAADYIIIAYSGFIPNVQPLAAFRAGQGLRVKVVDVQDVYDEFNDGLMDPQAIHDFLAYAHVNWKAPAPSFALLVGDGTFDPKGNCTTPGVCPGGITTPANSTLIPPYLRMVDPWNGETASDNRLVAFNAGNSLPSLAIGRLPANSPAEVDAMVAKIVGYEQSPAVGDWRTQVAFVADRAYDTSGNPESAGDFWAMSDQVASDPYYMPAAYTPNRIYYNPCNPTIHPQCALPYPPYTTAGSTRNAIVSAINAGSLIVNYVGHGAITFWSNDAIFESDGIRDDLSLLSNGSMLPVMLAMTCYDGFFQFPGYPSLAELNVRLAGKGALASWSASGLGVGPGHDYLDRGFFDAVMEKGIRPLGTAAVYGKTNLWLNSGGAYVDLIDTFNLLGDPASRLLSNLPPAKNYQFYLPYINRP